jgi:predicted nucleic acid-binding protein
MNQAAAGLCGCSSENKVWRPLFFGYVEVACALARRQTPRRLDEQRLAQLREDLQEDWTNLVGLAFTEELVDRAVVLGQDYKLRGADAVHLATALGLKDSLAGVDERVVLITSDQELLEAAREAGLTVEDPVEAEHHSDN